MSKANTGTWSKDKKAASRSERTEQKCSLCGGVGFVHPLLPSGQPDFSQIIPCRCIEGDLHREQVGHLAKHSNIGLFAHITFDSLSALEQKKGEMGGHFSAALKKARGFADEPRGWLMFCGPAGCGKTHLACSIANHRLSLGQAAFYIGTADLLDHLRSAFSPASDIAYDELFERIKNIQLLVLDDFGVESPTPWAKEKLIQLLNHRFHAMLPTVVVTDVRLEKMDERLQAFFAHDDFCRVCFIGQSSSLRDMDGLQLALLKSMTFDNFDYKRLNLSLEQRQNLEQAFRLAQEFARGPEGWLVFQGVNGCGKTHLAAAIANDRVSRGEPVFFIVVPDLLDHLRATYGAGSQLSYDDLFESIKKIPVLVLDDFGEQAATPWAQEKLYQLINYRYNARFPTVVTMCSSLDEIENRFSSRMVDPRLSCVFNIIAPDYRGDVGSSGRKAHRR